jgi:uncharacterized membrane protein YphA (DoxX/SURF4 family)
MKNLSAQIQKRKPKTNMIAISIGVVYLWFGVLKFFPNLSPAEILAKDTISALTFGIIPPDVAIILLAIGESLIGLLLIFNVRKKITLILALAHIVCTFTPMFFFPDQVFASSPLQPTLLGQYIGKNIIIIAALLSSLSELRTPFLVREYCWVAHIQRQSDLPGEHCLKQVGCCSSGWNHG